LSNTPIELEMIPLPTPEMTPPETKMYLNTKVHVKTNILSSWANNLAPHNVTKITIATGAIDYCERCKGVALPPAERSQDRSCTRMLQ
jgi:hypothetical protein